MKSYRSLHDYFNQLSFMDLKWAYFHYKDQTIGNKLLEKCIEYRVAGKWFVYQDFGFKKYQAYRVAEAIQEKQVVWDESTAVRNVREWTSKLILNEPIKIEEVLDFLEKDIAESKKRNRLGFTHIKILPLLIDLLFDLSMINRSYDLMLRIIKCQDYYAPYFQVGYEVGTHNRKLIYTVKFMDWEKMEKTWGISYTYFDKYRKQLCKSHKLSLGQFILSGFRSRKSPKKLGAFLDDFIDEICRVPYYDKEANKIYSLLFFENFIRIGLFSKARLYHYYPSLVDGKVNLISNVNAFLRVAMSTYNLQASKPYVDYILAQKSLKKYSDCLYLIAKYFLLQKQWPKTKTYLDLALNSLSDNSSASLYKLTYSLWFRYHYYQKNYSLLNKTFKQQSLKRKMNFEQEHHDASIFEISFYNLLAKHQRNLIKTNTFNKKLHQLLLSFSKTSDAFYKMTILENVWQLSQSESVELAISNRLLLQDLQTDLKACKDFVSLEILPLEDAMF